MDEISPFFYENLLNGQMVIYIDRKYRFMALVEVREFCSPQKAYIPVVFRLIIEGSRSNFEVRSCHLVHRHYLLDPYAVAV